MSGATGEIYRQFSITLISSMLLSVFVAMSLTPALCATILKAAPEGGHKLTPCSHASTRCLKNQLSTIPIAPARCCVVPVATWWSTS